MESKAQAPAFKWAIALHGGAGDLDKNMAETKKEAFRSALKAALSLGVAGLEGRSATLGEGATALDVVELVVRYLEDCPLFNAGRGSVLHADGGVEMEACVADGGSVPVRFGAVSGLTTVVNPVSLARLVAEKTPHMYLAFRGAERFADAMGVDRKPNEWFVVPDRREALRKAREAGAIKVDHGGTLSVTAGADAEADGLRGEGDAAEASTAGGDPGMGTVGCVAVDRWGRCASATSTGGLTNKWAGRIGDTPVVGTGTYANSTCAISATGKGEEIIRATVGREVAAVMEYRGLPLKEAVDYVVHERLAPGGGGLVAVSQSGETALAFNTKGMLRAVAREGGEPWEIAIW